MSFINLTAARALVRQYAAQHHQGDLGAVKSDLDGLSGFLNERIANDNRVDGTQSPEGTPPRVGRALLMQNVPDIGGFTEIYPARADFVVSTGVPISRGIAEDLLRDTIEVRTPKGRSDEPEVVELPRPNDLYGRLVEAASTIDHPRSPEQVRFNASERAAILQSLGTAPAAQLEKVQRFFAGTLTFQGMYGVMPWPVNASTLFTEADAPFRTQLEAATSSRSSQLKNGLGAAAAEEHLDFRRDLDSRPRRTAVLMIDAQYSHPFPGEDVDAEKGAIKSVLKRANELRVPVFEVVWPGSFETDADLAALQNPQTWTRVEKQGLSAFGDTNLLAELERRGITDVVLMGLYQEQCVQATALEAAMGGLRVHTSPQLLQSALGRPEFSGWEAIPTLNLVADHRTLPIFHSAATEAPDVVSWDTFAACAD